MPPLKTILVCWQFLKREQIQADDEIWVGKIVRRSVMARVSSTGWGVGGGQQTPGRVRDDRQQPGRWEQHETTARWALIHGPSAAISNTPPQKGTRRKHTHTNTPAHTQRANGLLLKTCITPRHLPATHADGIMISLRCNNG